MNRLNLGLLAVVVSAAVAAAGATTASAADMPVPTPGYYPPPIYRPANYNWTAFYFGGQVGIDVLHDTVTYPTTTGLEAAGTQSPLSYTDMVGGGQFGANYQISSLVVGVEGSMVGSNLSSRHIDATLLGAPNDLRSTTREYWYGSATGRVGYAFDTLLFYAKGGAAWTRVNYTQDFLVGGTVSSTQSIDTIRSGFVVGGGIEYGMTEHLSARGEYDFYDFGSKGYNFATLTGGGTTGLPASIQSMTHMITVGINYRFN
jgi:outer membrane immunogenic protein